MHDNLFISKKMFVYRYRMRQVSCYHFGLEPFFIIYVNLVLKKWKSKDWKKCDFSKMVSHTSCKTMQILKDIFPGHLISRNGDLHWPPRSPDLTAPDYSLWDFF